MLRRLRWKFDFFFSFFFVPYVDSPVDPFFSFLFLFLDRLITFERSNQVLRKREGYRERNDRFLRLDLDRVPILCYVLTEADSASCNQAFCKYRLPLIFHFFFFFFSLINMIIVTYFFCCFVQWKFSLFFFCFLGPNTLFIYVSSSCELPSTKYHWNRSFLVAHRFWVNFFFFFTIIQTYLTFDSQYFLFVFGKIYKIW